MALDIILAWTFTSECQLPGDVENMLIQGEEAVFAYRTIRDIAIFTTKRIIIRDAQGLTGKKVEIYTIPYRSIDMYSTENAGMLDTTAEVELWTKVGKMKINLKKGVDIRKIDSLLANGLL